MYWVVEARRVQREQQAAMKLMAQSFRDPHFQG